MNFREATINDLDKLKELEQGVVEAERPFNSAIKAGKPVYYDLEQLIADSDSCMLVVESDNELIASGYAQIRHSKPSLNHQKHAYLGFMFVANEHRGKGLNKQVMDELIQWSSSKGINDFYLDVYSENDSAIKAYEKAGFEPCLLEMKLHR